MLVGAEKPRREAGGGGGVGAGGGGCFRVGVVLAAVDV